MKRILLALALILASVTASAQTVQQSGFVTGGHPVMWTTDGIIQDGGPATSGLLTNVGITANAGLPFCINDADITGPYDQLCMEVTAGSSAQITLQSFNGAASIPLEIISQGTTYSFGAGGALITGVTGGTGITITGTASVPVVNLAAIASHDLLANATGGAAVPTATSISDYLDAAIGSTNGDTMFRGPSGWTAIGPGADGTCFTYHTAGPSITWGSCAGSGGTGTVTQIVAGTGLTGGTITTTGTIAVSYGTTAATAAQGNDSRITGALQTAAVAAIATSGSATDLITGTVPAARLPNPSASTLGGVESKDCTAGSQFIQTISTSGAPTCATPSGGAGAVLRSYIAGCTLSNDSGTPLTVLDVSACQATDSTNAAYITVGAFTKSIAGAWVAGTGNNGMGSGVSASANTWYHVFAIINAGVADIYFDTSVSAANAPASTAAFRRIGSIKTDSSSHILAFKQDDETFYWATQVQDLNGSITGTASLVVLSVPTGVKVEPLLRSLTNSGNRIILTSPDETDVATAAFGTVPDYDNSLANGAVASTPRLYTDTFGRIRFRASASSTVVEVTRGWVDTRGRFN